jgi:hypothetical protein
MVELVLFQETWCSKLPFLSFEVYTAVIMKNAFVWDVTPCESLIPFTLMMEATCSSEIETVTFPCYTSLFIPSPVSLSPSEILYVSKPQVVLQVDIST